MANKRDDRSVIREQPVTYDDYASMPDDGNRYEIIDGALEMMSPGPSTFHQSVSAELEFMFKQSCRADYVILHAPIDVILSQTTVLQPDILMIHRDRLEIVKLHGIEGAPDLVVEILSPGSRKRDKVVKAKVYAKYQVPEYWLVDPAGRTLEQYRLIDDRYELAELFSAEDRVVSDRLPFVSFALNDIFIEVDGLKLPT
ncbi:Uma2 family endonuclease [Paenibacillaceae bacterium WGS1546]|uniref:Uma2 family endonuclease n=1 Tax=Cohnella sp. WGS1546 TaxID=3366810 RepID=UPI00372D7B5E